MRINFLYLSYHIQFYKRHLVLPNNLKHHTQTNIQLPMKLNIYFSLFMLIFITSCTSDEVEQFEITDKNSTHLNLKQFSNRTCRQFDLSLIKKSRFLLNCIMDLKGETVNVPSHLRLIYDGGQIINGTLVFSPGATIDSHLLSPSLTLEGSPTLNNGVFELVPFRWGIIEGITTDVNAQKNKEILQKIIDMIKKTNGHTLKIDKLDAYFKVGGINLSPKQYSENSIHLPSDFTLEMTNNTFIRMQPTHFPYANLMSTYDVDNVTIRGGNLVGDRYKHDYSDILDINGISRKSHEWPTLLITKGSRNVRFENVHMSQSTGDGFVAGSAGFRIKQNTPLNKKVLLIGCTITDCRRNGISITDGEDITIENNIIEHTGEGEAIRDSSGKRIYDAAGVAPRFGLDIEPYVSYGNFAKSSEIRYEWVENVKVINNRFTNNKAGSIIVYKADNVLVDNNFSDAVIALNDTSNSTISNNTLEARPDFKSIGLSSGDERRYVNFKGGAMQQYAVNNTIVGNTVRGFSIAIIVNGSGGEVYHNRVYNYSYMGLKVDRVEDTNIHDNQYTSSSSNSQGILLTRYANNVNIYNETFTIKSGFIDSHRCNIYNSSFKDTRIRDNISSFKVRIYNNVVNARKLGRLTNSSGIELSNNDMTF